jgi:uncharacterized membrane-anchored protein YjiN (DUF445 family)
VDPVPAGLFRSRHGRRLRRLVCDRRAVPTAVGFANTAHLHRSKQQGAHRRCTRSLHNQQFITEAALHEKLAAIDVLGALGRWISEPANAKRLGDYAATFVPRIGSFLPAAEIGESLGKVVQRALATVPAAPLASKMLAIIWAQGEAQTFLSHAVEYSETWLTDNKADLADTAIQATMPS